GFRGSPASEAGVLQGDRVGGSAARSPRDNFEALDAVLDLKAGRETTLTVERDGRRIELKIVPAPRPADPRPDPIDDFALHTGLQLAKSEGKEGHGNLPLARMSSRTRRDLAEYEPVLSAGRPA